ncbi:hypothetical protein BH11ARM2_BH11ARM2_10230 [soil metagenome]
MTQKLTNGLLLSGLSLVVIAGCGNPSNCLSDSIVNSMVAGLGSQCTSGDPCGVGGGGGSTTPVITTYYPCAFKGNAGCGVVDTNGCNVKAKVDVTKNVITCTDYYGHDFTVECIANVTFSPTNDPCTPPPPNPHPVPCVADAAVAD